MKKVIFDYVYNRKGSLNAQGKALLQLRIYSNRSYKYKSTNIYLRPVEWDSDKQQVKVLHSNHNLLNRDLRSLLTRLENHQAKLKRLLNAEEIDNIIFDKVESANSFLEFIEKKINADKRISYSTYRAKASKLKMIKEYGKLNSFADLEYENIVALDNHLVSAGKADSTIRKYHQLISEHINKAISEKLFSRDDNPYDSFRIRNSKSVKIKFLTAEELSRIEGRILLTPRLNVIKDMFLFSCYTGLSYGDLAEFKAEHYSLDKDGVEWITKDRSKTSNEFRVPLIPKAKELFHQYQELGGKTIFPIKSNQKVNEYLKEIQTLCTIDKNLTFHMARHTFATTITMMHGVSVETVSKMLGHTNIKTTQIYAKIVDERIKNDMKGLL